MKKEMRLMKKIIRCAKNSKENSIAARNKKSAKNPKREISLTNEPKSSGNLQFLCNL